jgi:hypothetical protein
MFPAPPISANTRPPPPKFWVIPISMQPSLKTSFWKAAVYEDLNQNSTVPVFNPSNPLSAIII